MALTDIPSRSAGFKPFMEYAGSYALFNYRLEDPSRGLEYDNLRLIRAFEHGLDPTSSEAGFVLVHIAMVKESGALVTGASEMLESCLAQDRERFNDGLRTLVGGLRNVNAVMNSKCATCTCTFTTDNLSHVEP
jgi:indoleamine 2,3-dioxygenase